MLKQLRSHSFGLGEDRVCYLRLDLHSDDDDYLGKAVTTIQLAQTSSLECLCLPKRVLSDWLIVRFSMNLSHETIGFFQCVC